MYKGIFYDHYTKVPKDKWYYKDFSPREIASKGNGSIIVHHEALRKLQIARTIIGKPFTINSAYRDPLHNARVGGAPLSSHKFGHAFDISILNQDKHELLEVCKHVGFTGFGFYEEFLHVDCGKPRTWGKWL